MGVLNRIKKSNYPHQEYKEKNGISILMMIEDFKELLLQSLPIEISQIFLEKIQWQHMYENFFQ